MPSVDQVMTVGCECIGEHDSITTAAKTMQRMGIGALPICGDDRKLIGMLTDRDIVLKVIAKGRDPSVTEAGEFAGNGLAHVRAGQPIEEAIEQMAKHQVRRLPVIDQDGTLTGLISLGNVATDVDHRQSGALLERLSASLRGDVPCAPRPRCTVPVHQRSQKRRIATGIDVKRSSCLIGLRR